MRRRTVAVLGLVVVAAAGCGIDDPYADRAEHERGHATRLDGEAGTSDPRDVVNEAARALGNWTKPTVHQAYSRALALSVGRARKQLDQQEREISAGVLQAPTPLRARSTVEALTMRGAADRRDAIVVTKETITGEGIPGEGYQYKVTLAVVDRTEKGWAISEWAPQP
jgi:hypothetical protein